MKQLLFFILIAFVTLFCLDARTCLSQEKSNHMIYSQELNDHIYPMIKRHIKN